MPRPERRAIAATRRTLSQQTQGVLPAPRPAAQQQLQHGVLAGGSARAHLSCKLLVIAAGRGRGPLMPSLERHSGPARASLIAAFGSWQVPNVGVRTDERGLRQTGIALQVSGPHVDPADYVACAIPGGRAPEYIRARDRVRRCCGWPPPRHGEQLGSSSQSVVATAESRRGGAASVSAPRRRAGWTGCRRR
jgi:hypothetical protein